MRQDRRDMIRTIAAAIVLLAATALPALAQSPLSGTQWRFVEAGGASVPSGIGTRIGFGADGRVSGLSGCNNFHGGYAGDGAALTFSGLGWTKKLCPEQPAMDVERAIQSALAATRGFTRDSGTLRLVGAGGAVVARLAAQ